MRLSPLMPDHLITTAQAALLLGVTQKRVLQLVHLGSLPIAAQLPTPAGDYLIERAAVERLAAQRIAEHEAVLERLKQAAAGQVLGGQLLKFGVMSSPRERSSAQGGD